MILCLSAPILRAAAPTSPAPPLDTLTFGLPDSEKSHALTADRSDILTGGLGEPARRLLPLAAPTWEGGRVSFTLKVDPDRPTYLTARFWGSDINSNLLILHCEGRQIGYRHLGDVDLLDFGTEGGAPALISRFYYSTVPLPLAMTKGKTELHFEIRATGRIWGYGTNFDQYQKPMIEPTRGLYRVYTHTDGCFIPPADDRQGDAPANPPVRKEPGPEVMEKVNQRVTGAINGILKSRKPPGQMEMIFLAQAYWVKWTPAHQNPKVAEKIAAGVDALFAAWRMDPKFAQSDPAFYNSEWFGLGPAGESIHLLAEPLKPFLDQPIDDAPGKKIARRAAWSEMLVASRDWHRQHRRLYTNQSMIIDMNIQRANSGIAAIDPAHALPEARMRRYLYESIGLEPWLGSETDAGPAKPVGEDYLQITAKGLTRELGYVGYYGEVLDWVTQIYDATRPAPNQPGDEKIKSQLIKLAAARGIFRYPALDALGNRAMRIETIVGWRDEHYPGAVCYGERPTWDASTLYSAAATLDPEAIGYAQQMLADNQFFQSVDEQLKQNTGLRVTTGLLRLPDQYALLTAQAPSPKRLPMSPGQPDFVFADEEDGVVAIHRGDEILYISLYWRARYAINNLARVHAIGPRYDRIAIVRQETEFDPSGLTYTRPDWINMGFANGGMRYPGGMHSAMAGEKLPIAKIPEGLKFKPGDENIHAGRGSFYTLSYGRYLIGMNCSKDKTYDLKSPASATGLRTDALELISGKRVSPATPLRVPPRSTIVLFFSPP